MQSCNFILLCTQSQSKVLLGPKLEMGPTSYYGHQKLQRGTDLFYVSCAGFIFFIFKMLLDHSLDTLTRIWNVDPRLIMYPQAYA